MSEVQKKEQIKVMLVKLMDLIEEDLVKDSWEKQFVKDVNTKFVAGYQISDKQYKKIEEVFNKN